MKYNYTDKGLTNPGLVIEIIISPLLDPNWKRIPAVIDTGSYLTVFPIELESDFNTESVGFKTIRPVNQIRKEEVPSYYFEVCIQEVITLELETIFLTVPFKEYAILGRDFLNQITLVADGPNKEFQLMRRD